VKRDKPARGSAVFCIFLATVFSLLQEVTNKFGVVSFSQHQKKTSAVQTLTLHFDVKHFSAGSTHSCEGVGRALETHVQHGVESESWYEKGQLYSIQHITHIKHIKQTWNI
jgi:hypothetical protein